MRNSQVKNPRSTVSYPCAQVSYFQRPLASPKYGITQDKNTQIKQHGFESNYNYFAARIESNTKNEQIKPQRYHQRHASMDNSRIKIDSTVMSDHQIANSSSSPYLFKAYFKDARPHGQAPVVSPRNQTKMVSGRLTKHSKKLSMKNMPPDHPLKQFERSSDLKESQISTVNETSNTANSLNKIGNQKSINDDLLNFFKVQLEQRTNELGLQINRQNSIIMNLQNKIDQLSAQIKQKQNIIHILTEKQNQISQPNHPLKQNQNNFNSNNQMSMQIQQIHSTLNEIVNMKMGEQADVQSKINGKLEAVMSQMMSILTRRNQSHMQNKILFEHLNRLKQFKSQILKGINQNKQIAKQISYSLAHIMKVNKIGLEIKHVCSINQRLQQTAIFPNTLKFSKSRPSQKLIRNSIDSASMYHNQYFSKQKKEPNPQILNESTSYFFHPSELTNIDKITELFINRQGQPIQCYTDSQNQVKYKQTNTFMFNKKGDIVRLTDCEKKYYIDKGFIARSS